MKKSLLFLVIILAGLSVTGQTPQGINYQTVVRNGDGEALPHTDIWLKVSILADAPDGTVVYSEVHPATTNGLGLVNLVIGQGTALSGNFGEIAWSAGQFYLETAINFDGGAGFQLMGVTQLLSVPFAKYADFSAGLKSMTTEERNALESPPAGMTIYNTTTNCLNYWSGNNWFETCGACTPQPSNAVAGPEQTINTADTVAQLAGNIPAIGTGLWTKVSGSGGYFEDPNDPKTKFHGKPCTVYRLRWSISTSCTTKHSYVYITFNAIPTVATAGDDMLLNDETTTVTLSGNTPVVGNGLWTVVNGTGGAFANPTSPTTTFTGLPCQTYTLRWTIATACSQTYDDMNVTFDPIPTAAIAGDDVVVNTELTTISLAANTPLVGSGLWTVTGGEGGTFASATDPNTTFTGLPCQTYTLTWTISTACYDSNDEIVVVFDAIPTEAVAGEDVLITTQQTTITLAANTPLVGSGLWTVIGGDGGVFADATNPTTSFTALLCESYTLRWTISTPCHESFDEMSVTFDQSPATVSAGVDYTICQNNFHSLNGQAGNYSSVLWTTSGTGNFSNNAILNPTYTPGAADIIAGSVILTITVQPISPCAATSSDDLILTIQQFSTANAGADATICENTTHTLNGAATRYSSVIWSTSGTGTFSNPSILNPVYTPSTADKTAGSVTLTLIAQPLSPCALATIDQMTLSIQHLATANAGTDATICENGTRTLNGSATRYSSLLWTTSGTGTFSNPAILNPVYTPSAADKTADSVVLTLTAQPISPCSVTTSDNMVLTIQRLSVANAGADATICENQTHQLSGSALRYSSVLWSTSGTGTFSNPSILTPVYTPSSADKLTGFVTLSLTAQPLSPCAVAANDQMLLTILLMPSVYAGEDQIDLPGTNTTLQGNTPTGGGTGLWTIASGTGGIINQPNNPTSQFSGISGQTYLLQWAITAQNGCSNSDFVIISFQVPDGSPCPGMPTITDIDGNVYNTVKIGNQCWMNENLKTTKYRNNTPIEYPGSNNTAWQNNTTGAYAWYNNDIANKTTYGALYNWHAVNNSAALCPTGWHVPSDAEWTALTSYVSSQPAYLCNSNTNYIAKALAAKTNWNTNTGTCTVGNNLNANNATNFTALPGGFRYTFGSFVDQSYNVNFWSYSERDDSNAWSRNLYYSNAFVYRPFYGKSSGFSVRCLKDNEASSNQPPSPPSNPSPETGSTNQPTDLNLTWSCSDPEGDLLTYDVYFGTEPTPTLAVSGITEANYTPTTLQYSTTYYWKVAAHDDQGNITEGEVWSFTTLDSNAPVVSVGDDMTICETDVCPVSGQATNYTEILWSTTGDGFFEDPESLSTDYYPGVEDITNGVVSLCLNAYNSDYPDASDCLTVVLIGGPISFAGENDTVCESQSFNLAGFADNYNQIMWTSSGDGAFSNNSSLVSTYILGSNDINFGSVELCLNAFGYEGCGVEVSCFTLYIQKYPTSSAGLDASVCDNLTHHLTGNATHYSSVSWSSSGDGTFSNSGVLNPIYNPGELDKIMGSVVLTLTVYGISPCDFTDISNKTLTLYQTPVANAGPDQLNLAGNSTTLQGNVLPGTNGWWNIISGNGGIIENINNPTSSFSGIQGNTYTLQWNLTGQNNCSSGDSVIISFQLPGGSPCPGMPTVTDIEGNVYNTVQIGNQCWMKENLKTTKYRNGSNITYPGSNNTSWQNNTTGAYAWYNNDISYKNTYGALYNWHAVNNSAALCPTGWHVPSDAEWNALTSYVSSQPAYLCNSNTNYIAKALAAKTNWNTNTGTCTVGNNLNANNATNFTALPGGLRSTDGSFTNVSYYGNWWSSSQNDASIAWFRSLYYYIASVYRNYYNKSNGFSVRCLKDN